MASYETKTGSICLRIVLFANLIAIMAYGAIMPREMSKVVAECAVIGIAALAMAVQVYVTLAVFARHFYSIWVAIGLDALCAAGWCAAIAALSYWDHSVVYRPRDGDPGEWLTCAGAQNWDKVWTSDGVGHWLHLVWCQVKVDGRERLIGNGAARQQLHVLIGLSTVSLLFTGIILLWTIRRGQQLGLIKPKGHKPTT